jgi:hypothetical protein
MTGRRFSAGLALVLAMLVAGGSVRAEDNIWAALVLATNEHPAKAAVKELAPYVRGMHTVFGYNSFYLLGQKKQKLVEGRGEWIVPSKVVFLKLRCLDRNPASYTVQLDLYVKKRMVVTSKVKLARGAPLYIRGPAWGKGRLVFILEVR